MKKVIHGNLDDQVNKHPETRGWVLGSFMEKYPEFLSDGVEVKWARHKKGEEMKGFRSEKSSKTLTILIEGKFKVIFDGGEEVSMLAKQGDFELYDASTVEHVGIALEDSLLLVIRFPVKHRK